MSVPTKWAFISENKFAPMAAWVYKVAVFNIYIDSRL
jgi:hypothetical protein